MFKKGKKVTQKSKHEFGPVSRKEVAEAGGSLEEVYRRRAAAGDEGAKATIVRIEMKKHVNDVDEDDAKSANKEYAKPKKKKKDEWTENTKRGIKNRRDALRELMQD